MYKIQFIVSVRCFTFNQSKYIEETLDGFVMQKTSFPFICIIMDDDSQDGEPEVIKHYLEHHFNLADDSVVRNEETDDYIMTFAQHKENKNCYFAVYYLKYNHYKKKAKEPYFSCWEKDVKYIALCEGDDYWIYPKKLQRQVDFMETHSDYTLCYGRCKHFFEETKKMSSQIEGGVAETFEELMKNNSIPTATVLYRGNIINDYLNNIQPQERHWRMGDYPMWIYFAHEGSVKYMADVFAVYRVLRESASHSTNEEKSEAFVHSTYEIVKFYSDYFNRPELFNIESLYKALFRNAFMYGNKRKAIAYFKKVSIPTPTMKMKYFIIKNRFLYNLLKGYFFNAVE